MYTHTHTHAHTKKYTVCIHTCMCICNYMYVCIDILTTCRVDSRTKLYVYIYMYMHTHTHLHICMYRYTACGTDLRTKAPSFGAVTTAKHGSFPGTGLALRRGELNAPAGQDASPDLLGRISYICIYIYICISLSSYLFPNEYSKV